MTGISVGGAVILGAEDGPVLGTVVASSCGGCEGVGGPVVGQPCDRALQSGSAQAVKQDQATALTAVHCCAQLLKLVALAHLNSYRQRGHSCKSHSGSAPFRGPPEKCVLNQTPPEGE